MKQKLLSILALILLVPSLAFGLGHSNPSITTDTNFTCLLANAQRKYLFALNTCGANVMINVNGGTLAGITETSTNKGIVLYANGGWYEVKIPVKVPDGPITCYQTQGVTINCVDFVEGN